MWLIYTQDVTVLVEQEQERLQAYKWFQLCLHVIHQIHVTSLKTQIRSALWEDVNALNSGGTEVFISFIVALI